LGSERERSGRIRKRTGHPQFDWKGGFVSSGESKSPKKTTVGVKKEGSRVKKREKMVGDQSAPKRLLSY